MHYYNENNPKAAAWLRELINQKLIPPGYVDTRSITDVQPGDLSGYTQCHFFAGIGGWSLALQLAGWPVDKPIWSGSCPCQPFSQAGQGNGVDDERHLWPQFHRLIAKRRPAIVVGEQVASKAGREWFYAGVRPDLEGMGYAAGTADLCAASVGAPHIRQRLYWVGLANGAGWIARQSTAEAARHGSSSASDDGRLADTRHQSTGRASRPSETKRGRSLCDVAGCGTAGRLGDSNSPGLSEQCGPIAIQPQQPPSQLRSDSGPWSNYDILPCRDGKSRRVESGVRPLAYGVPGRVGLLRGYGNAIVPPLAAEFIKAVMEIT